MKVELNRNKLHVQKPKVKKAAAFSMSLLQEY